MLVIVIGNAIVQWNEMFDWAGAHKASAPPVELDYDDDYESDYDDEHEHEIRKAVVLRVPG